MLAPRMRTAVSTPDDVVVSVRQEPFVTGAITDPIKKISASTEQMMKVDHGANCPVYTKDEIVTVQASLFREVFHAWNAWNPELLQARNYAECIISVHREACCWSRSER